MRVLTLTVLCALTLAPATSVTAGAREDVIAQHKGLVAAFNHQDLKAAEKFYAPDYVAEVGNKKYKVKDALKSLEEAFAQGVTLKLTATLTVKSVKGDLAEGLELASLTMTTMEKKSIKQEGQKSEQRWKKINGKWKLAYEKSLTPPPAADGTAPSPPKIKKQ